MLSVTLGCWIVQIHMSIKLKLKFCEEILFLRSDRHTKFNNGKEIGKSDLILNFTKKADQKISEQAKSKPPQWNRGKPHSDLWRLGGTPVTTFFSSITALSPRNNFQKTIGKITTYCFNNGLLLKIPPPPH